MIKKKFLKRNIQLYGPNFRQWPIKMSPGDIHEIEQTIKQDPYLTRLIQGEGKFNQLLEMLPTLNPTIDLERNIYQAVIARDIKISGQHPVSKFLYSPSLVQWRQRKFRFLTMIPASFLIVLGCGWVLGQYYQQPTFEITDFYTDPAVSMIFEE